MSWEVLCSVREIVGDEINEYKLADGASVIVVRSTSGTIEVFQARCPHQQRTLADADLSCDVLTCAAHMWEFDVQTGEGINGTISGLARYPSYVVGGDLLVDGTAVEPIVW